MRLIDADALIKSLDDAIQDAKRKGEICDYWEDDRSNLLYYLDSVPTIDAVEVVRCRDCKYYYNRDPQQIPTSSIICGHMHPNDYCNYGERRE